MTDIGRIKQLAGLANEDQELMQLHLKFKAEEAADRGDNGEY